MAKVDKKVSIALFDKIAKEQFQNEATIEWHDAQLRVKYALSLTDMLAFVDDVVGSCFHDKLGYMPEVKDFAIKSNILSRYANFTLPDNLEHRYQLVYATDAMDAVCAAIDGTQLQEIVNSINSKIRFLCDSKAAMIQERINDILSTMEEMRDNTKSIFDGITQDDLKNLMGAITSNGLDEQELVQAYIEQAKSKDEQAE
ncbi:hypothetical protein D3Z52_14880 [Clostridiaceae bacterium]|nr:hypothetical protein [Clostridiaceae bacterium]